VRPRHRSTSGSTSSGAPSPPAAGPSSGVATAGWAQAPGPTPEFVDIEPCAREGRRLAEIRLSALEDRVDADLVEGTRVDLVAEIEHLVADHPFRERLWGQLMLALYRSGRQDDAFEALLVVALVAGGLFLRQRDRAERETREATARELAADSTLALEEDPELSMLQGLEAVRATEMAEEPARPEAVAALHTAVQASRLELRLDGGGWYVDASDDGTKLVTASAESDKAIVWDAGTGDPLQTLTGPLDALNGVAMSPDASRVAVAYGDEEALGPIPAVVVWDAATAAEVSGLMGRSGRTACRSSAQTADPWRLQPAAGSRCGTLPREPRGSSSSQPVTSGA